MLMDRRRGRSESLELIAKQASGIGQALVLSNAKDRTTKVQPSKAQSAKTGNGTPMQRTGLFNTCYLTNATASRSSAAAKRSISAETLLKWLRWIELLYSPLPAWSFCLEVSDFQVS